MPPNREPLKVIKVPLTYKPEFKTTRFPLMPRLYMELLENKQKVKPQLRNQEYIPKTLDNLPSVQAASTIIDNEEKEEYNNMNTESDYENSYKKSKIVDLSNSVSTRDNEDSTHPRDYNSEKSLSSENSKDLYSSKNLSEKDHSKPDDLINILKGGQTNTEYNKTDNYQNTPKDSTQSINKNTTTSSNLPPSLQEIGEGKVPASAGNYYEINVNKNDATEIQRKRDILHKFKYLKKYYTDAQIPEYNEYTDLQTLESEYNSIVKSLKIDSNVENYKKYLQMGFFGLEFFLSNVLKFQEIKGFSSAQMLNMNQYEKILVEIGEKSYIPEDKQLAPEIRLIGIILMNAAVFIGTKMLFKNMGGGLANMMSGMSGGNQSSPSQQNNNSTNGKQYNQQSAPPQNNQKKKTMRGPDMSEFEDLINKKNS